MDRLRKAVQGVFWLGGQYLADGFRRSVDTVCNVLHQVLEITGVKRPRVGVGDDEQERKKIKLDAEIRNESISVDNTEEPFKILRYVGRKSNIAKRLRLEKVRKRMRQRLYRNHSNNVKNIHDRINAFLQSKYKVDLVLSSNNCDDHLKEEPLRIEEATLIFVIISKISVKLNLQQWFITVMKISNQTLRL